tara:strand:+ start:2116 stop:2661 length:546 start_codon:yes stop_codon:yes gene_type:complete
MIWKFFKKKKEEDGVDALHDLVLDKMKPGYLVDFDMRTFRVNARNEYRWEEGGVTDEWELKQGSEVIFLERDEEDGEVFWTLARKTHIGSVEGNIDQYIIDHEDPPEKVVHAGITYYLEEDDIGEYFKGDTREGLKFVVWDYTDEQKEKQLSIEQWGEANFEVTLGVEVEEYQFSNILPAK